MSHLYPTKPSPPDQEAFTIEHLHFEGETDAGFEYNATFYVDIEDLIEAAQRLGMTLETFIRLSTKAWRKDA